MVQGERIGRGEANGKNGVVSQLRKSSPAARRGEQAFGQAERAAE
jgi:hypothetical protein